MKAFSISIVSHGHAKYVKSLLQSLGALRRSDLEVILTLNYPEDIGLDMASLPFPVTVITNPVRQGFAANHNAAFKVSKGDNFIILNPDVELLEDPFSALADVMLEYPNALYAPVVVNHAGAMEDSMRFFPNPWILVKKLMAKLMSRKLPIDRVHSVGEVMLPDWVAGMFIVTPRRIYSELAGLSERYHMYYEDVDFCARAQLAGHQVVVSKRAQVVHEAQRDSHRKLQYLLWHMQSACLFFSSEAFLKIHWRRLRGAPVSAAR